MSMLNSTLSRFWEGRWRRVFRPVLRRAFARGDRIAFGPGRGCRFPSAVILGPERSPPFPTSYYTYLLGIYEPHIQQAIVATLKLGTVFYDVGASLGFFSLVAARAVGSTGQVNSFEPFPRTSARLRALMTANNIGHCTVIERAVSSSEGTADFFVADGDNAATPSLFQGKNTRKLTVETVTLDGFAASHRPPDLIKLDVEGAEVVALQGATRLLASERPPRWIIEVHSEECDRGVNELLRSFRYDVEPLLAPSARTKRYPCHRVASKKAGT
jgi:FkbM family methyltransferase